VQVTRDASGAKKRADSDLQNKRKSGCHTKDRAKGGKGSSEVEAEPRWMRSL
jgi:hypothetical protein